MILIHVAVEVHEDGVDVLLHQDALDLLHHFGAVDKMVALHKVEVPDLLGPRDRTGIGTVVQAALEVHMDVHLRKIRHVVGQRELVHFFALGCKTRHRAAAAKFRVVEMRAHHQNIVCVHRV